MTKPAAPDFRLMKGGHNKRSLMQALLAEQEETAAGDTQVSREEAPHASRSDGKNYVWPASEHGGRLIALEAFDPSSDTITMAIGRHLFSLRGERGRIALMLGNNDMLLLSSADGASLTANQVLACLRWPEEMLPIPGQQPQQSDDTDPHTPATSAVSLEDFLDDAFDPSALLGELDS